MTEENGLVVGAVRELDDKVCMVAYRDDGGGLLAVEYPAQPLTADLAASIMANLIKDVLGPEPELRDVMAMQRTLVATLQGGGDASPRTAG